MLAASVFVVALVFFPYASQPFEPTKLLALEAVLLVGLAVWPITWFAWQKTQKTSPPLGLSTKLFYGVLVLNAVALAVSLYVSIDPWLSWHGGTTRALGVKAQLYILILALAAFLSMRSDADRYGLLAALAVSVTVLVLYALLQRFELDPMGWSGDVQIRPPSALGNPNFLSAFLLLCLPLLVWAAVTERRYRSFNSIVLGLCTLGIILAASRATSLALAAAILFFALYCFIRSLSSKFGRFLPLGLVLLVLLCVVALLPKQNQAGSWLERQTISLDREGQTALIRLKVWRGLEQAILQPAATAKTLGGAPPIRVLFGYGANSTSAISGLYYDPDLRALEARHSIADHAHNRVLGSVIDGGILGFIAIFSQLALILTISSKSVFVGSLAPKRALLAYVGVSFSAILLVAYLDAFSLRTAGLVIGLSPILVWIVLSAWRSTVPIGTQQGFSIALLLALTMYWIEQLFSVPSLASECVFWIGLGCLAANDSSLKETPQMTQAQSVVGLQNGLGFLVLVSSVGFAVVVFGLIHNANLLADDVQRQKLAAAISANRDDCLTKSHQLLNQSDQRPSDWALLSECALTSYARRGNEAITNAPTLNRKGVLDTFLASEYQSATTSTLSAIALSAQARAQQLQPFNADYAINIAKLIRFFSLDGSGAIQALDKAALLRPQSYTVWLERVEFFQSRKDYPLAQSSAEKLYKLYPSDEVAARKLARMLQLNGRQGKAIETLKGYLMRENGFQTHSSTKALSELAVLLAQAGRLEESLQASIQLAELLPASLPLIKNVVSLAGATENRAVIATWCSRIPTEFDQRDQVIRGELAVLCAALPTVK